MTPDHPAAPPHDEASPPWGGAILVVAPDGTIVGCPTRPGFEGRRWEEVVPPPWIPDLVRALGDHSPITLHRRWTAGRCFAVHVAPIRGGSGVPMIYLVHATEAAGPPRRSDDPLVSIALAHALRNPLAGISGALQVFGASIPAGPAQQTILDRVGAEVARLDAILTDLLVFAQPQLPHTRSLDLAEVARQALADLATDAAVVVRGQGTAAADGDQLGQILIRLAHNAFQAGADRIVVQVSSASLVVADDGPGVPEDLATRLFDPFVASEGRGAGLGLAISRRRADAMGWCLELLPHRPLGGAAFRLSPRG